MEGDTPSATQSHALAIQVTSPAPLSKLQYGVPTTINFSTSGVTGLRAIARIVVGGPAIAGDTPAANWVASSSTGYSTVAASQAVDTSGTPNAAPAAVYSTALVAPQGVGQQLEQSVAVANGTYLVTLDFAEYQAVGVGGRLFNIVINGVTEATNFDIYAAAGDQTNTAVDRQFTVTASKGEGIVVQLVNVTANYSAVLSGIEVDRKTASVAARTAEVEVSPDNGTTWEVVDAAAPLDAYGNGSINWTPNFITNSNVDHGDTALVRVIVNGSSALSQNFLVTNAGNDYYINGNSTTDAEYTTAVGNDLNSGKTPNAPMADLAALLRAYTLLPGDVVYIDTGSYVLLTDLILGASDSGAGPDDMVTFQGPTHGTATLNRRSRGRQRIPVHRRELRLDR